MKTLFCRTLVTFLSLMGAADATAQTAAAGGSGPTAPAPEAPAATPTLNVVRVHVRAYRQTAAARAYARKPDGSWSEVCTSPCTIDVPVGAELRLTMGNEDEPHSYVVSGELGPEVDLEVRRASLAPLIGPIVTAGSGGALLVGGLLIAAFADTSFTGSSRNTSETKTVGFVCAGIGAAVALGGLVWLGAGRSHEPRVSDTPHRAAPPRFYGREGTLHADVVAARQGDVVSGVPAPTTPWSVGFSF